MMKMNQEPDGGMALPLNIFNIEVSPSLRRFARMFSPYVVYATKKLYRLIRYQNPDKAILFNIGNT